MGTIGFSVRAWWEEKQTEGATFNERIHLESATKGQYKLLQNTDLGKLILFFRLALDVALRYHLPSLPTFSW